MSGLEERLRKAVGGNLPLDPQHLTPTFVRDAIVAACVVLAEEFGPRPEDAAPPVLELPTEPGAVVLVTGIVNTPGERAAFLGRDAQGYLGWHYVDSDGDMCTRPPGRLDWQPATVVPTAAHEATVKALRDVVELLNGPQSGDVQEAQDAAINALADIEGWAGL